VEDFDGDDLFAVVEIEHEPRRDFLGFVRYP
jgi:hypothetical protein